jgi:hypothetical protein
MLLRMELYGWLVGWLVIFSSSLSIPFLSKVSLWLLFLQMNFSGWQHSDYRQLTW